MFEARRRAFDGQRLLQEQKIAQSKEQIDGYDAQLRSQQRQMALIEEEARGTRELFEKGFAPKTKVLALDRTDAPRSTASAASWSPTSRARNQQIGEAELQILQLAKDRLSEVADQLRDTQTKLLDVAPRLAAARDTLDHTELKAPRAGYVVGLTAFTVGGVIAKGDHVLDVVPVESPLVVEGQVKPEDIEGLRPGAASRGPADRLQAAHGAQGSRHGQQGVGRPADRPAAQRRRLLPDPGRARCRRAGRAAGGAAQPRHAGRDHGADQATAPPSTICWRR